MVLPTHDHDALTRWINERHVGCASEYGGVVCLSTFGPVEHLIDPDHLTADVHALFGFARQAPRMFDEQPPEVHRARELLREPVLAALSAICSDLAVHGLDAQPNIGLGAIMGDEIFRCGIRIHNPARLAELLGLQ